MVSCMGNDGLWLGVDIHSPSTGMGHSLTGKGGYINVLEKHIHLYNRKCVYRFSLYNALKHFYIGVIE